jgi:hypothetical protein
MRTPSRNLLEFEATLPRVPIPLRYQLLKIYFLTTGSKPTDIDEIEGMMDLLKEYWSSTLFMRIDRGHAIGSLKRLCDAGIASINPRWSRNSILSTFGSPTILLNLLQQNQPEALDRATCMSYTPLNIEQ